MTTAREIMSERPRWLTGDATVAEAALRQPGPVAMLTSDIDDMARLCGDRVRLIGV